MHLWHDHAYWRWQRLRLPWYLFRLDVKGLHRIRTRWTSKLYITLNKNHAIRDKSSMNREKCWINDGIRQRRGAWTHKITMELLWFSIMPKSVKPTTNENLVKVCLKWGFLKACTLGYFYVFMSESTLFLPLTELKKCATMGVVFDKRPIAVELGGPSLFVIPLISIRMFENMDMHIGLLPCFMN